MPLRTDDPAYAYIDQALPGRKWIVLGIVPMALIFLFGMITDIQKFPAGLPLLLQAIFLLCTVIYLIGYWQAVRGKGYPGIIWIAAFSGPIGLIVILFLPNLRNPESAS